MSFKKVAAKIARKGGYSKKAASAILASASRNASAKAKRKNPKLKKVKGKPKKKYWEKHSYGLGLKYLKDGKSVLVFGTIYCIV